MIIEAEKLVKLQGNTKNVRNICVLAHVDHGKTTLSDSLISSNGIINPKVAGKVRYMDSRPDEQERQITMKSSSISLIFTPDLSPISSDGRKSEEEKLKEPSLNPEFYLINLIDSPGHVDFSSEVSTAVRFSDGAIVVVDVIEGVCAQTHAVLQQAWNEGVKPCLVINKIDRLITEVKMTTIEAYFHITKIIESLNAFTASMNMGYQIACAERDESIIIDDEKGWGFDPTLGNVVFASAFHCWAFSIPVFAEVYSKKLGMNKKNLEKILWGDFYYNPKTKKVVRKPTKKMNKPMFVQLILDNIWKIYSDSQKKASKDIEKVVKALGLKISNRDLMNPDWKVRVKSVMSKWLPIPYAVLGMVVHNLPSPNEAQSFRLPKFWSSDLEKIRRIQSLKEKSINENFQDMPLAIESAFKSDNKENAPVLIFVGKMVDMMSCLNDLNMVDLNRREYIKGLHKSNGNSANSESGNGEELYKMEEEEEKENEDECIDEENDTFIAFARVFSGTLDVSRNINLYVFGPKYDETDPSSFKYRVCVPVKDLKLYLFMGKELIPVSKVPAGNICGIRGLQKYLFNMGTISSLQFIIPFKMMNFQAVPIVHVSVLPEKLSDMKLLSKGLLMLGQADPNLEISIKKHEITASGELHLERCLTDLKERFAKGVSLNVSKPIIDFRETIVELEGDEAKEGQLIPEKVSRVNHQERNFKKVKMKKGRHAREFLSTKEKKMKRKRLREEKKEKDEDKEDKEEEKEEEEENVKEKDEIEELNEKQMESNGSEDVGNESDYYYSDSWGEESVEGDENDDGDESEEEEEEDEDNCEDKDENEDNEDIGVLHEEKIKKIKFTFSQKGRTPNKLFKLQIRCVPLPGSIIEVIIKHMKTLKGLLSSSKYNDQRNMTGYMGLLHDYIKSKKDNEKADTESADEGHNYLDLFFEDLKNAMPNNSKKYWNADTFKKIWSLGPKHNGPNILLNEVESLELYENMELFSEMKDENKFEINNENKRENFRFLPKSLHTAIINGFQLSCENGPLCGEPLMGVCFVMEDITISEMKQEEVNFGRLSGQVMSAVKDTCFKAIGARSMRLMEAYYSVELQTSVDVLGKLEDVITRRRGKIVSEDMKEGTPFLLIKALLPVAESIGFSVELRKKTKGVAQPQLVFSHWELMEQDPFWKPSTEDEKEEFGDVEKENFPNLVRDLVNSVRERKGLTLQKKIVEHAEKQRTLAKKK